MNNFKTDLRIGQNAEINFVYEYSKHLLINNHSLQSITYNTDMNKLSDYDLIMKINDKDYSFEIKKDKKSHTTGNIAIEYSSTTHSSGLSSTLADYYVYEVYDVNSFKNKYIIFNTTKLKNKILQPEIIRTQTYQKNNAYNIIYNLNQIIKELNPKII